MGRDGKTLTTRGGYSVSCDKTTTDTLNAIRDGKNVSMNIFDYNGEMVASGVRPIVGRTNDINFISGVSAFSDFNSYYIRSLSGEWHNVENTRYIDFNHFFGWATNPDETPCCKALKFNHADALPDWHSIEYIVDLGDDLDQLLYGAIMQAASSGQKLTLGADISTLGETTYFMCKRVHDGANHGEGGIIRTYDSYGERNFRVISTYYSYSDNCYQLCSHGRIMWGDANNTTFDITIDAMAKMREGDGDPTYEAYAAVTVDPITITFV